MRRFWLLSVIGVFWSIPASADKLDGNWCRDGKRLTIDGPKIIIPSGRQIEGNYARHYFDYQGPEGDPEAGQDIRMEQRSDELMLLYRSTAPDKEERWQRCLPIS